MNTLYDGTINCFSTLAQTSTALNETFSYNQALKQDDFREFIKAMIVEVSDHESRDHWTLTKRCDMPEDTKTIMSIWSFKRKRYACVHMAECKRGARITGRHMLQ